jgi:hypothetical protein
LEANKALEPNRAARPARNMTRVLNTRLGDLIAQNGRAFVRYHQNVRAPWRAVVSHTLVVCAAACLLVALATSRSFDYTPAWARSTPGRS